MPEFDDILQHYGVLGMKWGRRKADGNSAIPSSEDHARASTLIQKPMSSLSNSELQTVITRINLENQYKNLSKGTLAKGRDKVGIALAGMGTTLVANAIKDQSTKMVKKAFTAVVAGVHDRAGGV